MDEKTRELRDIFMDVTDEATVTERQEAARGSLTGETRDVESRLREVVADMREAVGFDTGLDDAALVRVVRGFYEGESDAAIAEALDVARTTVFRARMDLHLFRDRDTDAPFDLGRLREGLAAEQSTDELAAELDVSASTVRRYARVVETQDAARRVSNRYRSAFDEVFTESDLSGNLTGDAKRDGLDDALDGMESNVSF
ncbi:conditioned medium-induced protein 4 [Halorarius litoreus]|uniref:conditioned medium-induced protein 4 n=1 Tax=Halorarius litoreus TaxID=2962676 RepID=UPI0020CE91FE|nr:conditioned medium-induced protein 4 [Halorarius litoreus]